MNIEWDNKKADSNLQKHSVSFTAAATVFDDVLARTRDDPDHSFDERRFVTIGMSHNGNVIVVVHTWTDSEVRIISARYPTPAETRDYEESI